MTQSKKSISVLFATLLVSMSMHGAVMAAQPSVADKGDSYCETWDELGNYASRAEFIDSFIKNPQANQYLELASLWEHAARPQPTNYCKGPQASSLTTQENARLSKFFSDSGFNRDEVYAVSMRVKNKGLDSAALTSKEKDLFSQLVRHSSDLLDIYRGTNEQLEGYLKQRGLAMADLKEF